MRDILLIQLGRLGDLVQTLPLIRRIKQEHPESSVTLVCLADFQGVIRESGGWDRLVPVRLEDTDALAEAGNREAFPGRPPFDAIPEFRESYDLAVTLNPDLGSAALCDLIPAARKRGRIHAADGELRLLGDWAKYMFAMVSRRTQNLYNVVDINMGLAGLRPAPQEPALPASPARREEAREMLRAHGWRGVRPLVALQTGASDLHRAWDVDHFASLAARLAEDGAEVALLGDARESERAREVRARSAAPLIDLVGKTGLPQLGAVAGACDLLVSNDTGTIHVAAAAGTPTLGLFFASAYFAETAPYGDGHAVLQVEIPCSPCSASTRCAQQACRSHLPVAEALQAARWMLRPGSEPPRPPRTLGLYRSRFLANGTLLYAPAREDRLSDHYRSGLLGRRIWDRVLGIAPDPFLEGLARRARESAAWHSDAEALRAAWAMLSGPIREGAELAGRLRHAFAAEDAGDAPGGAVSDAGIRPLHDGLARVGRALSQAGDGMLGDFVRLEMMDLPYARYPRMAGILEEKYRSLALWSERVREALEEALAR